MKSLNLFRIIFVAVLGFTALTGCQVNSPQEPSVTAGPFTLEEAQEFLSSVAEEARQGFASLSFEEFKASVYKEPFEGGKYIVDGDTPIANDECCRSSLNKIFKILPYQHSSLFIR